MVSMVCVLSPQEETAPAEPVAVYTVNPDRVTIAAKSSCQLEFFGFSTQPGQIEEHFVCSLGNGVKSKQTVFDITARCVYTTYCFRLQALLLPQCWHIQICNTSLSSHAVRMPIACMIALKSLLKGSQPKMCHHAWHFIKFVSAGPPLLHQCCSSLSASWTGVTAMCQASQHCP